MLTSAQLYKRDRNTGKEGLTLAALLLFGTEEAILSVVPHHRTDALLRVHNLNRYDDRDDIRVNLIESYDRLMAFVAKHLPDPFYQEESGRVSLRNKIFREAVSNLLIHREFTHAYPAKMIIEKHRVVFENANRPHGHGLIDPNAFTPFPKNPVIGRVFKEIGLADELGSGVRNIYHYSPIYSHGGQPRFYEDDIFKVMLPLTDQVSDQVSDQVGISLRGTAQVTAQATEQVVLDFCMEAHTTHEIMKYLGLNHREYFRAEILKPLLNTGKLKMTLPDKPKSPKQKYYTAHIQGENSHE